MRKYRLYGEVTSGGYYLSEKKECSQGKGGMDYFP